jgi:hypothetical protein
MTHCFDNVAITPFTELLERQPGAVHRGGPHWPDFERQKSARHCRRGRPVDEPPAPPVEVAMLDEAVAWGGPIVNQFGHQIADFTMRLLPTVAAHPGLPIAFCSHPRMRITTPEEVPPFVRATWEWLGVRDVRIISRDTLVRELVVEPQAEQLCGPGPDAEHLDRLDALSRRLTGRRLPIVYVSRAAQAGRLAGEEYLEHVMTAAGGRVIRPETIPLPRQLRIYASADRLIFAEGSAVHGTQLLGRSLGDVSVIVRRSGDRIAKESLEPRARSLSYLDVSCGLVHGIRPTGGPARQAGISIMDGERLGEGLRPLVPGIERHFDIGAFNEARDNDVLRWFGRLDRHSAANAEVALGSLRSAGLGHLVPAAERAVDRLLQAWTLATLSQLVDAVKHLTAEVRAKRARRS